jgi:acetyltransferase-like isoleucine patch superfamily enzyme
MKSIIQQAWDMPWVPAYEVRRILALPYIRLMFKLHGIPWGKGWRVLGMPIIQRYRGSQIKIGDRILLRSWPSTNPITARTPVVLATRTSFAQIQIGKDVGMTGTTIVSAELIKIGDRVQIGSNTTIVDTDFHPLDPAIRQADFLAGKHAPVIIENDVFVGMNSLILKGLCIGEGAVIGAASVVLHDVPPRTIVAGNPAREIRRIE